MRRLVALSLLFGASLYGQAPAAAVFDGSFPDFKSMTIGVAHCWFWSHLPAAFAPWVVEAVCYINGEPKYLTVGAAGQSFGGWFSYCDNGTFKFVDGDPSAIPPVLYCGSDGGGGNITWKITPNGPNFFYSIVGGPFGGVQVPAEGSF